MHEKRGRGAERTATDRDATTIPHLLTRHTPSTHSCTTMSRTVDIPVGDAPGWELEDESMNVDGSPWHSVADRCVQLHNNILYLT